MIRRRTSGTTICGLHALRVEGKLLVVEPADVQPRFRARILAVKLAGRDSRDEDDW